MVLSSLFFIIIFADIDEKIKISISSLFAYDAKVSAKIRTQDDTELLQQYINRIYKWADDNLMQYNERKFKQMSHGGCKEH